MTLEINTSVASGWNPLVTVAVLCTVGAPMAKEHPPGGQGISHSPADGSNCSSEVTFLPSVVNTWQTGPFCPGLRPLTGRPVVRTAFSAFNGPFRCASLCPGLPVCRDFPTPQPR